MKYFPYILSPMDRIDNTHVSFNHKWEIIIRELTILCNIMEFSHLHSRYSYLRWKTCQRVRRKERKRPLLRTKRREKGSSRWPWCPSVTCAGKMNKNCTLARFAALNFASIADRSKTGPAPNAWIPRKTKTTIGFNFFWFIRVLRFIKRYEHFTMVEKYLVYASSRIREAQIFLLIWFYIL